jgi:two-component sensor histidine kinase/CheY-like chemotaxis protein
VTTGRTRAESRPNVLVVDDIEANIVAIEASLGNLDCNVVRATSGNEALLKLLDRPFAVMLLDARMPGMDGFEVARLAHGNPATRHVPIIFITALHETAAQANLGYRSGAVDFLFKPFDPYILRSKVQVFLDLYLVRRELDATVRERTEQLRERELLLREINHRVKNNLQIISGLLNMQAQRLDVQSRAALEDCNGRVQTIARIHEQLCESPDLSRVPIAEYLRDLATSVGAVVAWPGEVAFTVDCDDVTLPISQAMSCGLMVNELVMNAVRHAFPDGRKGTVRVALRTAGDRKSVLSVGDDGVGLPPTIDPRVAASLGFTIVRTLVKQLKSTLEIVRDEVGTVFRISFAVDGAG